MHDGRSEHGAESSSIRVLVVDDDPDIRQVVRRALEREQIHVLEAEDAEVALQEIASTPVDVVLLDLHLPGRSGLEALSLLRAHDPELHVIMLTGASSEADRVLGLVSGADDYVVKPFSARELAARVIAGGRRRRPRPATIDGPVGEHAGGPATEVMEHSVVVILGDTVVYANSSALQLLRAPGAAEVVGHVFFEFVAPQSLGASMARQQSVQAGGLPRPEVITLRRVDGQEVLVEVSSTPVLWKGQPASQVTLWDLASDSSKLRELVTGIRTDVAEAIIIMDARLRIQSFNPAAEVLYGWREDEVRGRDLMEVLPWLSEDTTPADAREAMREQGRWQGEVVQARRDGSPVSVRTTSTVLRDDAGQHVGVISVNRPIGPRSARLVVDRAAVGDELAEEVRRGIAERQFTLHYQPVVRLHDGGWVGAEALVRWQHPERGLLPPSEFIAAAERSGDIVDLGQLVLDEASREWSRWRGAGSDLYVAVNLSGRQLADPDLADRVGATIRKHAMPRGALCLEVTETSLVEDLDDATRVLRRLADLGASISIDDFGTGWASLTYLREFPVHALKIDRAFVAGLGTSPTDAAIAGSILSLGAELGLSVVAEGIETTAQAEHLQRLGCALGQGYLYARPAAPDELEWPSDG